MPRLKVEEVTQLSEPIVIEAGILGDKEYVVRKVTTDVLKEVDNLSRVDGEKPPLDTPVKQLALLLDVPTEELIGIDLRVISRVLNFITDSVTEGVKSKNPMKTEVKS